MKYGSGSVKRYSEGSVSVTIVKIIKNTYDFVEKYISPDAPGRKEHIGYIIDRVGFELFKEYALKDVTLMPETKVHNNVYWSGIHFDHNNMN